MLFDQQLRQKVLGPEHLDTLTNMNNLALVLSEQGKYMEAEQMHQQELGLRQKVLGSKHPSTLASVNILASLLSRPVSGQYILKERWYSP